MNKSTPPVLLGTETYPLSTLNEALRVSSATSKNDFAIKQ